MSAPSKIVLGSVLKPVDDIRLYHKLALSYRSHSPTTEIVMVAAPTSSNKAHQHTQGIRMDGTFDFKRLSPKRGLSELIFFTKLLQYRPRLVIVSTYELLWASIIYKFLFKAHVIYDIQENYSANIMHGPLKPIWAKKTLSWYVATKEKLAKPFIDGYILAERCYEQEMDYPRAISIMVENKVLWHQVADLQDMPKGKATTCCITGTLGHTYGTLESLDLALQLKALIPNLKVLLHGYCADEAYLLKIKNKLSEMPFVTLLGGDRLCAAEDILKTIAGSHFALMLYQTNESIRNKIPTKFYECMALKTYIFCSKNETWARFLSDGLWGMDVDLQSGACQIIYEKITSRAIKPKNVPHKDIFAEPQLQNFVFWIDKYLGLSDFKHKLP